MTRRVAVALAAWTAIVTTWFVILWGGRSYGCLGPLAVTEEQCRAANGLPPATEWDRLGQGPAPLIMALVIGWLAIALVARLARTGRTMRQRGGL